MLGATLHYVAWAPQGAFKYCGHIVDAGQVLVLLGARNDGTLERVGYIARVTPGRPLRRCRCGADFVTVRTLIDHAAWRHNSWAARLLRFICDLVTGTRHGVEAKRGPEEPD